MSGNDGMVLYQRDSALWRQYGVKVLLAFLTEASGEQHDAAVYDTGYEFDPSDPDAVRFIACAAMTKASSIDGNETFSYPMPSNGSVAPASEAESHETFCRFVKARKIREDSAEFTYIPDQSEYAACVVGALKERNILYKDMTPEERVRSDQEDVQIDRENRRFILLHVYLPIAALAVFAVIGLVGILRACGA